MSNINLELPPKTGNNDFDSWAIHATSYLRNNSVNYPIGTHSIISDTTISDNITVSYGTIFSVGNGITLTITSLQSGNYKIFETTGTGKVVINTGSVRPEWWGGFGDDSTDCTAAFASANTTAFSGVVPYGPKQNILLSKGVYRVTATSGNYAITTNCPINGEGPDVSIIKNMGAGSALKIEGVNGEIYYSLWSNFSVVGNASSEDGIVLNVTADINKAVGYGRFDNVDCHGNGRHGLVHNGSWATHYTGCKFFKNGGLGVYLLGTGAYSQHNNVIFQNCDSRWNGGTGDASTDYLKGGVRFSGLGFGVYWLGGVVESNNAWGFIIGSDATYLSKKIVIEGCYGEGHPDATFTSVNGGFLIAFALYTDVSVSKCTIGYGAPAGKVGYAFYINDAADCQPRFLEYDNLVEPDLRAGTAIRDYQILYPEKWGSAVEIIDKQVNRDFSGTNNWVNDDFNSFDSSGDLSLTSTATQGCHLPVENINSGIGMVYGKRYGIKYSVNSCSGVIYFSSYTQATKLPNIVSGNGQAHEFIWLETNANQNLYIYTVGAATANIDNVAIYEIDGGVNPQTLKNGALSYANVALNANADTLLYIVPTGKRAVLSHAILIAGADAGATTTISIGNEAATYANFIPTNTLSNLDAENDAVILMPIPNTTPLKIKSYAADSVIYAHVANQSGGAVNRLYLFGVIY